MKNLTWQNPEQLFVAQELINKVKSKCCGIKANKELANKFNTRCLCPKCNLEFKYNEVTGYSIDSTKKMEFGILSVLWQYIDIKLCYSDSIDNLFIDKDSRNLFIKFLFDKYSIRLNESDLLVRYKSKNINKVGDLVSYIKSLKIE